LGSLAARPADEPVVMINLLQFHADGGPQSYLRYVQEVAPHLERVGGTVQYAGAAPCVVIGDYPSPVKVHEHRAPGWTGAS
jgi:hypothetical protein